MTAGISMTEANEALDAWLATYTWLKLHIGDPGAAGLGSPALNTTRQQATWGTAASGNKSNTNVIDWTNVPNAETYTHVSVWTASSAGTFGGSGTISGGTVAVGNTFRLAAGDVDATVAAGSIAA
jgi:hypothetical protein